MRIRVALATIAGAAEEQSVTAEQVSAAASELAAQIVHLNAMAKTLRGDGEAMAHIVSTFRLERPAINGKQIALS
jgi:hypothetical protein